MAVVDRKSTQLTNRDATPAVKVNASLAGGLVKAAKGQLTGIPSGDSSTSIYRIMELPTTAVMLIMAVANSALGGSCAADIGVYRNTRDGGAVVDADLFASAVSLVSTNTTPSIITGESTVMTTTKFMQPLWQAAGLSADPGGTLDICATLTADTASSGALMLMALYVD